MKLLEKISALAGKYFAILVIVVAVIAFLMPDSFSFLGQYITILLGVVMFGMGLTLKPVDFKLVLKNPLSVIGGVLAQFIVMPLAAFIIAYQILAGKYFAILVIVVAVIAFLMPDSFSFLGQYITILLGVVMFGMGLTLKPVDFKLVLKNPLSVIGGVLAQFIVMPLAAFIIAY